MTSVPFDLLGPLPRGTTVLEASAGTGKTFTVAGLVARYIGEGLATMDQLLVVSFSRESTRELRERVRERLVSARDGLTVAAGSGASWTDRGDAVLAQLADVPAAELDLRRRRLGEALAAFDAATVTTTHGFCQQVLTTLGTSGDQDPGELLVEDVTDLVREVADDLYLRKWGRPGSEPAELSRTQFHDLALAVVADGASRLVPDPAAPGPPGLPGLPGQPSSPSLPGLRARIAAAVRTEVALRKRRQHLLDYDDMLTRLAGTLTDPEFGPPARARLRARYRVVLVDEFQDTDPVQWSILREPFHGHTTLVLIGDPKQAIYGFRGADVHSYLQAVTVADTVRTLPTSYRSDALLLAGLDGVFHGAALGDERIRVAPVRAAHTGRLVRMVGADLSGARSGDNPGDNPGADDTGTDDTGMDAAVRLRVLPRDGLTLTQNGTARTNECRDAVLRDLSAELVMLLSGGARVQPRGGDPQRRLLPGDVAVLVRTNLQAQLVSRHLGEVGIPVVVTGRVSVFSTAAATEWQLLLEAMEQPHRMRRVRRLALGCFVGLSAAELDTHGDAAADELALRIRDWLRVLDERGVAALFEAVSLGQSLQQRILGQVGGERLLTDLRHIAQTLHEAAQTGRLGLTGLLTWLRRRCEEAVGDGGLERSRRLESDAAAVQVITVHTSKGLEFPVVLVPFAWDLFSRNDPTTAAFHDEADQRVRDVGGPGSPDWTAHVRRHKQEETDDELRLSYVALTRAQSALLLWWAPSFNTPHSPLHRLLLHDDSTCVAPARIDVPSDALALQAFQVRAEGSGGGLAIQTIRPRPAISWAPPAPAAALLAAAVINRPLDSTWRRTSYSALTAAAHDQPALGSEPEVGQTDDEPDLPEAFSSPTGDIAEAGSTSDDDVLRSVPSGWDSLAGGTAFGTLVHSVLELLDEPAQRGSAEAAIRTAIESQALRSAPDTDVETLTTALTTAFATPLGAAANDRSLQEIPRADQLRELDFELPLAGGDEPRRRRVLLSGLASLWRAHCPTGPLAQYAQALDTLGGEPLRGYLNGSIDVVLRVRDGAQIRYLVVDYKTNRLGGQGEPLTAWHYRPASLERAMIEAHYPLQALLYNVALHRYLRWRQPGYLPEQHLGGSLYVFLRGMSGPGPRCADGSVPGVFSWRPPAALITDSSDLLAGLA